MEEWRELAGGGDVGDFFSLDVEVGVEVGGVGGGHVFRWQESTLGSELP